MSTPSSPSSSSRGSLDLFAEPADFRPSTPPPQLVRVPYDFTGSTSSTSLSDGSSGKTEPAEGQPGRSDDLQIELIGSHPLWGHHIWNASLDISRYLQRHAASLVKGKSVLELGAAAGIPSIVCAREGAGLVVATDYPDKPLIDTLGRNLDVNVPAAENDAEKRAIAEGYLWGSDASGLKQHLGQGATKGGFDLMILSDLVFNHQAHDALLDSLSSCLSPEASTTSTPESADPHRLSHDEGHPDFPDLPLGELTAEGSVPQTPCALVFFTSHRPHLAHKDMDFFVKAEERGWTVERVGRWRRDVSRWELHVLPASIH